MKKVITYGTYDLFHEGHYNLLKRAKELGDYLIVGVTTDHFDESRGKINTNDDIMTRIENVKKTGFADKIIVEDHDGQKMEDIQKYGVDIFTLGSDWKGAFDYLNAFCKVIYLPRTPNVSSSELRELRHKICRCGIVGTGRIAPRFIAESRFVSGIEVVSAYNPIPGGADSFKKETDTKVYTEDYESFLADLDAVYVASTHETHYEYTKKALLAGKHVLCEKPMTFTRARAEELYDIAKEKHLVLMEAIKAAYCPGFVQLINLAKSGKIGKIRDVEACFSRLASAKSREMTDEVYGGSFLEYGGYPLLPVIKLLGKDFKDVSIDSIKGQNGTDIYTKIQIRYEDAMATVKTGTAVKSEGQLVIAGEKGYILAPSPWWLTEHFEVHYEDTSKTEDYNPRFVGDGLRYEISEFVNKIHNPSNEDYRLTAGESIAMADVVELFMKKSGKPLE